MRSAGGLRGRDHAHRRIQPVESNTANFFQYNDEALLKVLKMGAVTSQDIAEMKEKGAIILEDGGDIQWLIKEVSDTALENYKKRLREDMHIFSAVPNLTDANFGGNLSGVAVETIRAALADYKKEKLPQAQS